MGRVDLNAIESASSETARHINREIVLQLIHARQPISRADLARVSGYLVELDRGRAIELAVGGARPSDVVLIAGKGHEDYQLIGTEKRHFDDREQARAALSRRRATAQ